jgi:hypothetical protein
MERTFDGFLGAPIWLSFCVFTQSALQFALKIFDRCINFGIFFNYAKMTIFDDLTFLNSTLLIPPIRVLCVSTHSFSILRIYANECEEDRNELNRDCFAKIRKTKMYCVNTQRGSKNENRDAGWCLPHLPPRAFHSCCSGMRSSSQPPDAFADAGTRAGPLPALHTLSAPEKPAKIKMLCFLNFGVLKRVKISSFQRDKPHQNTPKN